MRRMTLVSKELSFVGPLGPRRFALGDYFALFLFASPIGRTIGVGD
jgi:hypothetical protein